MIRRPGRWHWTWRVTPRPFDVLDDAPKERGCRGASRGLRDRRSRQSRSVARIVAVVSSAVAGGPICASTGFGLLLAFAGLFDADVVDHSPK